MYHPADVRWDVLNDIMSSYYLHNHAIFGLNALASAGCLVMGRGTRCWVQRCERGANGVNGHVVGDGENRGGIDMDGVQQAGSCTCCAGGVDGGKWGWDRRALCSQTAVRTGVDGLWLRGVVRDGTEAEGVVDVPLPS